MREQDRWAATKHKQEKLLALVLGMAVKDKRRIFSILRGEGDRLTADTFLPCYGLHCGEFAFYHLLAEHARKGPRPAEA